MKFLHDQYTITMLILFFALTMLAIESVQAKEQKTSAIPVFNIFELGVQADKAAAYDAVGENNITRSITDESGTLSMVSVKDKENPNLAYIIEVYADDAAYRTHLASPQYKAFTEQAPSILTDHKLRLNLAAQYLGDKGSPIKQNGEMITNMVRINVLPGEEAAFKAAVMPEMVQSLAVEDGVLAIYAGTLVGAPNTWLFFEIYASESAYQAHRQTPHFQKYLSQTQQMLGEKTFYNLRPALLKNKGGLHFNSME